MTDLAKTDELFFQRAGLDRTRVDAIVADGLDGMDDGELFLEYRQSESLTFDDGRLKNASFDTAQGFGLRAVVGETTGYSHATELSEDAILRAAHTVQAVRAGHAGTLAQPPIGTNRILYMDDNPLQRVPFDQKVELLQRMDAYARPRTSACIRSRLASRSLAGGADPEGGRRQGRRHPPPRTPQRLCRGREGWPHGGRHPRHGWTGEL